MGGGSATLNVGAKTLANDLGFNNGDAPWLVTMPIDNISIGQLFWHLDSMELAKKDGGSYSSIPNPPNYMIGQKSYASAAVGPSLKNNTDYTGSGFGSSLNTDLTQNKLDPDNSGPILEVNIPKYIRSGDATTGEYRLTLDFKVVNATDYDVEFASTSKFKWIVEFQVGSSLYNNDKCVGRGRLRCLALQRLTRAQQ